MIRERAPAKVNLLLHVGRPRDDGLHELCSLFASIRLSDDVTVEPSTAAADRVVCEGVDGENICQRALATFRAAIEGDLPALDVTIDKRIPVAAGLGGGSADAAAALRAANELAGRPLDPSALRTLAARVGADVPSQVEVGHALVTGAGERVEPIELPAMALVLVPQAEGLATADVYAEADRLGATRDRLDPQRVRALAKEPLPILAPELENDLQAAALWLRPTLADCIEGLYHRGALSAAVTGSGPTVFGVFEGDDDARSAADSLPGALVTNLLEHQSRIEPSP